MRSFRIVAALGCLAMALLPVRASAEGALAVGVTANRGATGVSIGYSTNWAGASVAQREALRRCLNNGSKESQALCAVISDIHRECVATAATPDPEPGFGWGIDPDLETAKQQALEMCQQTAGPDHARSCRLDRASRGNSCDMRDQGR